MKIDSHLPLPSDRPAERITSGASSPAKPAEKKAETHSDKVLLLTDQETIEALKANLKGLPEVRWERVDALRQAVQNGTFQVTDHQLADAMLDDLLTIRS
jgi:flagellar biosynthesis anti-sigma factor FlgM